MDQAPRKAGILDAAHSDPKTKSPRPRDFRGASRDDRGTWSSICRPTTPRRGCPGLRGAHRSRFVHLDRAAQEIDAPASNRWLVSLQVVCAAKPRRSDNCTRPRSMRCRPSALTPCLHGHGHVPHRLEPKAQWLSSRPRRSSLGRPPMFDIDDDRLHRQLTPTFTFRRPGVGSAASSWHRKPSGQRTRSKKRPHDAGLRLRTTRRIQSGCARSIPAFGMGCRVRHPNM